jgi:hypothetical protein
LAFFDRFLVRLPPDFGGNSPVLNNVATLNVELIFVRGGIIIGFGFGGGLDLLNVVVGFGGNITLSFTRADFASAAVAALLGLTDTTGFSSISP